MDKRLIVIGITILIGVWLIKTTLPLRYFNYETRPIPNLDEYNYIWQAESLKRNGLPMAWTLNTGEYKSEKYNSVGGGIEGFSINSIDRDKFLVQKKPLYAVAEMDYGKGKEQISFVTPFFDHPPLGGLIYDLGMPQNLKTVDQVKPSDFRKSAIVLAVVTSGLLFILTISIFRNPWVPLLTVLIYSSVPTYVLATRTTYLENAVSPLVVLSLIFVYWAIELYNKKSHVLVVNFLLLISGFVVGLSVLVKEPAIGFVLGILILLLIKKVSYKKIAWFGLAAGLPLVLYFIWGMRLQKELFWGIFLTNSGRGYFGAIKMVTQLEALKLKNFPVDGWWVWGFISYLIISLSPKSKRIIYITVPLTTHLLTVLLMGSPNYPWYLMSCIPFLAISSAILTWQIVKKPNWANSLAFFLIPFSSSYYWGRAALNIEPSINHYRYIFGLFILILVVRLKWPKNIFSKYLWWGFLGFLMYRVLIYNQVAFPYLMAHWGSLPVLSLPNY